MEVTTRTTRSIGNSRTRHNSFECDSEAMDAILGIRSLGERHLRIDQRETGAPQSRQSRPLVYAPIELVLQARPAFPVPAEQPVPTNQPNAKEQRDRLLVLESAWYDASEKAASAAEELLSLYEHHQQQWLSSPTP